MDNFKCPIVPKNLLDLLEKRFPDRMPDHSTTFESYLLKQGELTVVRFLRHQFNLQNQNILEN